MFGLSRWRCRDQTDDERYQKFDCGWVGNWLRPGSLRPRKERLITPLNRDEWVDSVELREVRLTGKRSVLVSAPAMCILPSVRVLIAGS